MSPEAESLPLYAAGMAHEAVEREAVGFEQPPDRQLLLVLEDDRIQDHHIVVKEGHTCAADCPDHGHHDHADHDDHHSEAAEAVRSAGHGIVKKSPEHACGADCPEHGHDHHAHQHFVHDGHGHGERAHGHGHRITPKAHVCAADCPEHAHGHEHVRMEAEHHIEVKTHHHRCGPDCPEHGHSHALHEHQEYAAGQPVRGPAELSQPVRDGHFSAEAVSYYQAQEAVRRTELAASDEPAVAAEPEPAAVSPPAAAGKVETAPAPAVAAAETAADSRKIPGDVSPVTRANDRPGRIAPETSLPEQTAAGDTVFDMPADRPVEPAAADTETGGPVIADPEAFLAEPVAEAAAYAGGADIAYDAGRYESLGALGIEPVPLPLSEPAPGLPTEAASPVAVDAIAGTAGLVPTPLPAAAPASLRELLNGAGDHMPSGTERAAEIMAEAVSRRLEELEAPTQAALPERVQAVRRTLRILAGFRAVPANEQVLQAVQRQLVQLLQLLGYENPSQTLTAYLQRYGVDFTDELLLRLLELQGYGHSREALRTSDSPVVTPRQNGVAALGMLVLQLLSAALPRRRFSYQ